MTKQELLKQKIKAARAAARAAYAAYDTYIDADTAYDAYNAAYDVNADAAAAAAVYAAAAADAAVRADLDKHIAILEKATERAYTIAQNTIWKTQALKYKKEVEKPRSQKEVKGK